MDRSGERQHVNVLQNSTDARLVTCLIAGRSDDYPSHRCCTPVWHSQTTKMAREEDAQAQAIAVPSKDPVKKDTKEEKEKVSFGDGKDIKEEKKDDDLSEEDLQLKNELEMLVDRLRVSSCMILLCLQEVLRPVIHAIPSVRAGIRQEFAQTCLRVLTIAHQNKHIFYDLSTQAPQVPKASLSRHENHL
jgi:hypothetical protein